MSDGGKEINIDDGRPVMETNSFQTVSPARGRFLSNWLIPMIAAMVLLMSATVVFQYRRANHLLDEDRRSMAEAGRLKSVEGCVDELIAWSDRCRAPVSYCRQATESMMGICLNSADRLPYCNALTGEAMTARFGYPECKSRGLSRGEMQICASAYSTVASYCHTLLARKVSNP